MAELAKRRRTTKRDAVFAAATKLLLARGFENTSMDAVAAEAGVSKTTVYAHFTDKVDLFRVVMADAAARFAEDLSSVIERVKAEGPKERLEAILVEIVRSSTTPQLLAFFRVHIAEIEHRDVIAATFDSVQQVPDLMGLLAKTLEEVAADEGFELPRAYEYAQLLLRMSASSVQFDLLFSGFSPGEAMIAKHSRLVAEVFLNGIRPRADGSQARFPQGYDYPWGPGVYG